VMGDPNVIYVSRETQRIFMLLLLTFFLTIVKKKANNNNIKIRMVSPLT
jgi:hypothetical protein